MKSVYRLNDDEIARLITGESLVRFPPVRPCGEELESFYRGVVKRLVAETGTKDRTEWNHYGSGYASYVDGWIYYPDGRARVSGEGEHHFGVVLLLSRLSSFYVVGQAEKGWHQDSGSSNCASSYLPDLNLVDSVAHPALFPLEQKIDQRLAEWGMWRLRKADLQPSISTRQVVPTILSGPPHTLFDALFYWED